MGRRRIAGDDQVEIRHHSRRIVEGRQSIGKVDDREFIADAGQLVTAGSLLQAEEMYPITLGDLLETIQPNRTNAVPWMLRASAPHDADLKAWITTQVLCPPGNPVVLGAQIRHLDWNRRDDGLENPWQTQQRSLDVERGQRLTTCHQHVDAVDAFQKVFQFRLALDDHGANFWFHQRDVTDELEGVSKSLFGMKQDRRLGQELSIPKRLAEVSQLTLLWPHPPAHS